MIGIRQSPANWSSASPLQQRPRAAATASLQAAHCAATGTHGSIPALLTQAAARHTSFTALPQKLETGKIIKDTKQIRQDTNAVFKALSECETNTLKNFGARKNKNSDTATSDKRNADIKKAYKILRDSPNEIPKAENEKFAKKFAYGGQKTFRSILSQHPELERNIDPLSQGFRDVKTGLYCELRQTNTDTSAPEFVLCFPGTGAAAMDRKQWSANINQAIGKGDVPPAYRQAAQLTELIKTALDKTGAKLTVAGHSMGGGIANYVGLKHDISSVCYNAAPLGGACLRDLGAIPKDRLDKQLHIRCKGDPVSSPKVQQKLQSFLQIWNKEKIWVPRNAGTICEVSRDYASEKVGQDRHLLSIFDAWYDPLSSQPKTNINLLQMA